MRAFCNQNVILLDWKHHQSTDMKYACTQHTLLYQIPNGFVVDHTCLETCKLYALIDKNGTILLSLALTINPSADGKRLPALNFPRLVTILNNMWFLNLEKTLNNNFHPATNQMW